MNGQLTDREEEVLDLLSRGMSTKAVAERLWISPATVRNHVQSIMTKLGVHSRLAAVPEWRRRKGNHADRVLAYCRRAKIPLTSLQVSLIRSTFQAREVACEGQQHIFPVTAGGAITCLCGAIRVDSA